MSTDFYKLLGVSQSASQEELKRAYRKRARELHPDANPNNPEAEEQFKELSRAYEVLSDQNTRARYDQFGEAGISGGGGRGNGAGGDPFGGGGFGSIFDAFFGGDSPFGGGGGRGQQAGPQRGPDLETQLRIEFAEAVFGCTSSVTIRTAVRCDDCSATGAAAGTSVTTCSECGGTGQIRRTRQSILGQMVTASPCGKCRGAGQRIETPCATCHGEGRVTREQTHSVEIPAGIATGQTMRVTSRGGVGPRGGEAGDLYLHIEVGDHEMYRREENDLITEVKVSISQAALGAEFVLATLDGDETLVVPAGVQHGNEFVLKGRGVPTLNQGGRARNQVRGDLRVQIAIFVPKKLNARERELLEELAKLRGESFSAQESRVKSKIKSAFS